MHEDINYPRRGHTLSAVASATQTQHTKKKGYTSGNDQPAEGFICRLSCEHVKQFPLYMHTLARPDLSVHKQFQVESC